MPIRNEHNFVYMCRIHVTVHMTFLLTRVFSSTFFQAKNIEMSFSQEITTDLWADREIQPNEKINWSKTNLICMFLEDLAFLNHFFLLLFWVYPQFLFFFNSFIYFPYFLHSSICICSPIFSIKFFIFHIFILFYVKKNPATLEMEVIFLGYEVVHLKHLYSLPFGCRHLSLWNWD